MPIRPMITITFILDLHVSLRVIISRPIYVFMKKVFYLLFITLCFQVIICAFMPNSEKRIVKIPENQEASLDVYMTRPLSLLCAADRSELNKILLHLSSKYYIIPFP